MQIWSHRGRTDGAGSPADNTPDALTLVAALGLVAVEIDTWRTADGHFVVGHDRDTPAGLVDTLERAAVSRPDLADLLDAAPLDTVNVELKVPPGATAREGAALGAALAGALGAWTAPRSRGPEVVVSSFSRAATDAVAAAAPGLPVSLLCSDPPGPERLRALGDDGYWGLHARGTGLDGAEIEAIHAAGLAVVAWTVNDPDLAVRLMDAGLDAVITDVPLALQQQIGG